MRTLRSPPRPHQMRTSTGQSFWLSLACTTTDPAALAPAPAPAPIRQRGAQSRSLRRIRARWARSVALSRPKTRSASVPRAARIASRTPAPCSVRLNQRGPAVGRVRAALGQATGLKGVGHLGDRTRGDAQVLGQFRQAHVPVIPEHAQRPEGRRRDVPGGQRLVGGLPQPPRHGPEGLRQRLVGARISGAPGRRHRHRSRIARTRRVVTHRNIIATVTVVASY